MADKAKILVVMGGVNSEAQVSMDSGILVVKALINLGYEVDTFIYDGSPESVVSNSEGFDLVFNALHGGDGEDGTLQAVLDEAKIRYTGSGYYASKMAMDKHLSKMRMLEVSVPTAEWICLDMTDTPELLVNLPMDKVESFAKAHPGPLVIKPSSEGSTVGLTIAENMADLHQALMIAREFGPYVLVEEYIPGRELTVTVLDGKALPIVEIKPKHSLYDYECKYTDGGSEYMVPAEIDLATTVMIQDAAVKIYRGLRCRQYSRVDFRLSPNGRFYCLELNTLPGLTSHSLTPMAAQAVGLDFEAFIEKVIRLTLGES